MSGPVFPGSVGSGFFLPAGYALMESGRASSADITPSVRAGRIPGMSLEVDGSQYFLIHHTQADTIDKIDPVEMAKCAATVAVMAYVVADLPQRLAR